MEAHERPSGGNSGRHREANRDAVLNQSGAVSALKKLIGGEVKEYYIAAFVPEEAGNFSVYVPDIPDCVTGGYSLAECVEYGEDIFREMFFELVENNKTVPPPSGLNKVREMVQALRAGANLPYPDDTVYQLFASPQTDDVPVRVTISLPKKLLAQLDRTAKAEGFTRSGFLAHAAQQLCTR